MTRQPAEIFAREVLSFLVGREILSPERAEGLLFWRYTGFNVHSTDVCGGEAPAASGRFPGNTDGR